MLRSVVQIIRGNNNPGDGGEDDVTENDPDLQLGGSTGSDVRGGTMHGKGAGEKDSAKKSEKNGEVVISPQHISHTMSRLSRFIDLKYSKSY